MSIDIVLLILFLLIVLFFCLYVFHRLDLTRKKATREEALRLGLLVEDVERDLPISFSNNQPIRFKRHKCVRYSLRKARTDTPRWSFLQRVEVKGIHYLDPENWQTIKGVVEPEIWKLAVENGDVPDVVKKVLTQIASAWTEEYLEFEGTPTEVSAYWEEWGGPQQARIIYTYLQEIAKADTKHA